MIKFHPGISTHGGAGSDGGHRGVGAGEQAPGVAPQIVALDIRDGTVVVRVFPFGALLVRPTQYDRCLSRKSPSPDIDIISRVLASDDQLGESVLCELVTFVAGIPDGLDLQCAEAT